MELIASDRSLCYDGVMANDTDSIASELVDELIAASEAYYSGDEPIMEDQDFDEKQSYLASILDEISDGELRARASSILESDSVNLGASIEILDEVRHGVPMLSLKKAKSEEELRKFLEKLLSAGATGFKVQVKLDGFALSARYEDGKLVGLATRGDGNVGENLSYLMGNPDITIVGLPDTIATKDTVELRGELFFTEGQFASVSELRLKAGGEPFKNSRNAVVGLQKKAAKGLDFPVEFSFSAYAAWRGEELVELSTIDGGDKLDTVEKLTAREVGANKIVLTELAGVDETVATVQALEPLIDSFDAPNDGVVIKATNESSMQAKMGSNDHHPSSQIAYKYPTPTFPAEVLEVTYSVGKTGRVSPRGRITPTDVMGTVITFVSLHNFDWIYARDLRVGSKVAVTRANKVIPYIKAVLSNPDDAPQVPIPTSCPACGTDLVFEDGVWPPRTIRCANMSCPARDFESLLTASRKGCLDFDGMSNSTVEALHEAGKLNTIADFYALTEKDLADSTLGFSANGNPRRLGEKRAHHIYEHIQKSKTLPLQRLLVSLSVQFLGNRAAKSLIAHFGTFDAIRSASVEDVSHIDGMGPKRAQAIVEGLRHRSSTIDAMIAAGVEFSKPDAAEEEDASGSSLEGMSFSISGSVPAPFANRDAWVEFIEAHGGEFHSGPKATTSYMVAESSGSSAKIKKALQLGVTFITAQEFTEKFSA